MWISSFVVTLPADQGLAGRIRDSLTALPVFQSGAQQGDRLPVVLETPDGAAARDWYEFVRSLPGVVKVDLAFVSFDNPAAPPDGSLNEAAADSELT